MRIITSNSKRGLMEVKMPVIQFKNNQLKMVDLSTAKRLQRIIDGRPTDDDAYNLKLLRYCTNIDKIQYEDSYDDLHKLMKSAELRGYEKFKAIGQCLQQHSLLKKSI